MSILRLRYSYLLEILDFDPSLLSITQEKATNAVQLVCLRLAEVGELVLQFPFYLTISLHGIDNMKINYSSWPYKINERIQDTGKDRGGCRKSIAITASFSQSWWRSRGRAPNFLALKSHEDPSISAFLNRNLTSTRVIPIWSRRPLSRRKMNTTT